MYETYQPRARTSLTEDEKNAYIAADLCLINAPSKLNITGAVTRWDDIQWPHVVQTATVHFVVGTQLIPRPYGRIE